MNIQKTIIQPGTLPPSPNGRTVSVHYTGRLTNGQIFDSSRTRGQPFNFVLGAGQVIQGWDLTVASMNVGEKCEVVIPPEFGYGARGVGPIPPNSTLIFEIELLGYQ